MSRRGGQRATVRQEASLPCFTLTSREIAHRLHRYRSIPTSVLDQRPGRVASATPHTVPSASPPPPPLSLLLSSSSAKQERALSASLPQLIRHGSSNSNSNKNNNNSCKGSPTARAAASSSAAHLAPHLRPRRHPLLLDDWPDEATHGSDRSDERSGAEAASVSAEDEVARYETWLAAQCPIGPWRALVYDELYGGEDAARRYYVLKYSKRNTVDIAALIHGEAAALAEQAAQQAHEEEEDKDKDDAAHEQQQQQRASNGKEADTKRSRRRAATPPRRVRQPSSLRRRIVR